MKRQNLTRYTTKDDTTTFIIQCVGKTHTITYTDPELLVLTITDLMNHINKKCLKDLSFLSRQHPFNICYQHKPLQHYFTTTSKKFANTKNKTIITSQFINTVVLDLPNLQKINTIEVLPILKGGGLTDLLEAIFGIGELFVTAFDGVTYLIEVFIWSIKMMVWFMKEVANPEKLLNEFGATLKTMIMTIVYAPIQLIYYLIRGAVNMFDRTVFNGFWGWDRIPYDTNDRENAAFFSEANNDNCKGQKCYLNDNKKIPFKIIIGTIICPPLGVFMEYGLSGWINIIICIILSLIFYFPGLIYGLMCLYC